MNDGFAWWLLILGIAIGIAVVWMIVVRLPRDETDVDDEELASEAGWISRTIRAYGGVAPEPLVEEVLELHRQYLNGSVVEPSGVAGLYVEEEPQDDGPEDPEPVPTTPPTAKPAPVPGER
jgi:hypothetical protein